MCARIYGRKEIRIWRLRTNGKNEKRCIVLSVSLKLNDCISERFRETAGFIGQISLVQLVIACLFFALGGHYSALLVAIGGALSGSLGGAIVGGVRLTPKLVGLAGKLDEMPVAIFGSTKLMSNRIGKSYMRIAPKLPLNRPRSSGRTPRSTSNSSASTNGGGDGGSEDGGPGEPDSDSHFCNNPLTTFCLSDFHFFNFNTPLKPCLLSATDNCCLPDTWRTAEVPHG